jgi:hypothetical protein
LPMLEDRPIIQNQKRVKTMVDVMTWNPELFCFSLVMLLLLGLIYWTKRHQHQ